MPLVNDVASGNTTGNSSHANLELHQDRWLVHWSSMTWCLHLPNEPKDVIIRFIRPSS